MHSQVNLTLFLIGQFGIYSVSTIVMLFARMYWHYYILIVDDQFIEVCKSDQNVRVSGQMRSCPDKMSSRCLDKGNIVQTKCPGTF